MNDDDILQLQILTSGIDSYNMQLETNRVVVYDTGGQRAELKKWISLFDDVSCIFHVAAVSEFDQTLMEDPNVNRWQKTVMIFNDIKKKQN